MDFVTMIGLAFGLALDTFAVSMAAAVITKRQKVKMAVVLGLMFGGFQMLMPVVGWSAGCVFRSFLAEIDHWIAFGLLLIIGAKMIWEALKIEAIERVETELTALVLLGLSIATSIDALAVGISFAFLRIDILLPVIVIGLITFVMSFVGAMLGGQYGGRFEKKIEIVGGVTLILIGLKILWSHLSG